MRVVFGAAEAIPIHKTGGLGDMVGSLARALAEHGHQVTVLLPYWPAGSASAQDSPVVHTLSTGSPVDPPSFDVRQHRSSAGVEFLLIDAPPFFSRPGLYTDASGEGWIDNAYRFAFFGRAFLRILDHLNSPIDIVHLHDWHTGLIPWQSAQGQSPSRLSGAGIVFTIHNAAYQGRFPLSDWRATALPESLNTTEGIEFWGDWSMLKAGILSAHRLTTVSPTYARELLLSETGMGFDGILRQRASRFTGIVNGIDPSLWDPATDESIFVRYDAEHSLDGKRENKRYCQQRAGLPVRAEVPLIGIVSRLVEQKGIDVLSLVAKHLLNQPWQFVLLGQGDSGLEDLVRQFASCYPDRVHASIGYDDAWARQIYAGADWFFMPSRYEPCGLSQLYAMRYGAVPIVHAVGGLADTVTDASPSAIEQRQATGFAFHSLTEAGVMGAFKRANDAFRHPSVWQSIVTNGMTADWSWQRSVCEYEMIYADALRDAAHGGGNALCP